MIIEERIIEEEEARKKQTDRKTANVFFVLSFSLMNVSLSLFLFLPAIRERGNDNALFLLLLPLFPFLLPIFQGLSSSPAKAEARDFQTVEKKRGKERRTKRRMMINDSLMKSVCGSKKGKREEEEEAERGNSNLFHSERKTEEERKKFFTISSSSSSFSSSFFFFCHCQSGMAPDERRRGKKKGLVVMMMAVKHDETNRSHGRRMRSSERDLLAGSSFFSFLLPSPLSPTTHLGLRSSPLRIARAPPSRKCG